MSKKEDALTKKEAEIQADLSAWVKKCGLFGVGEQIQISLKLIENPAVILASNKGKRVKRWVTISSDLADDDWKLILTSQTSGWCSMLLELINKIGNRPFRFAELEKELGYVQAHLYSDSVNVACFSRFKLPYRIRVVDPQAVHPNRTYQIFKVSPLYRKK